MRKGDRVIWDDKHLGTVTKVSKKKEVYVHWDNELEPRKSPYTKLDLKYDLKLLSKENKKVELAIYKADNSLGISLMRLDENDNGEGYRVFGPKLRGQGTDLKKEIYTEKNIQALERLNDEIKNSVKFLKQKIKKGKKK